MRRALLALVAAGLMQSAGAQQAQEPVTLNFVNADIESVAAAVGKITNRNFLIDPRVKGTVNLVSARPVPTSAVYGIFLSALRLQGSRRWRAAASRKSCPRPKPSCMSAVRARAGRRAGIGWRRRSTR